MGIPPNPKTGENPTAKQNRRILGGPSQLVSCQEPLFTSHLGHL